MSMLRSFQLRLVENWQARAEAMAARSATPAFYRRGLAELLDRLMPLPFLAFFFNEWVVVVFLYHLLCCCSQGRRSVGMWVCRLRVISVDTGRKCAGWQAAFRRAGSAVSQAAWCLWQGLPFVLAYELISLASVLIHPRGRRPEDWLAGTQVVTERGYRRLQKNQR
ncbi:MAG: RDD family protein [Blastocatellia bacterium]